MASNRSSSSEIVSTIVEHDVLLGRGGETNSHVGNRNFRRIVFEHQAEYLAARKKEKAIIARRIVDIIKSNGGRFLKKDANHFWVDAGLRKAVSKTSQALREGLDVRNHCVREKKIFKEDDARQLRVVMGKVASPTAASSSSPSAAGSSSIVSCEHDSQSLPDLDEEGIKRSRAAKASAAAAAAAATGRRPKPPLDKSELKAVCEV
jgi:hypothetical protein